MNGLKLSPKLMYIPSNSKGNDYIVGDLHGMFTELLALLEYIGFDDDKDRLISVGDLIDRGPQSIELLREFRIRDNWYFVRGNHEQMMIDSFVHNNDNMYSLWLSNGGTWIFEQNMDELKEASIWLEETIPTILVVGENENRYNVCHAELIKGGLIGEGFLKVSNKDIDEWNFSDNEENQILWGRNIYNDYEDDYFINDNPFIYHSNELSTTYVGHTPHFVDKNDFKFLQLEKHVYMDTGACFTKHNRFKDQAVISILNHTTQHFYFMDNKGQIVEGENC